MTTNEQERKRPLNLARSGRLELKKTVETGQVRQSFPHGRTKTVTVEVKRKRSFGPGSQPQSAEREGGVLVEEDRHANLTASERAVRLKALEEAKQSEDQRRSLEQEVRARAEEEAKARAEAEAALKAEESRRLAEAEARRLAEEDGRRRSSRTEPAAALPAAPARVRAAEVEEEEVQPREKRAGRPAALKPQPTARREEPRRRTGKLTISQALDEDAQERVRSLASVRRAREREKQRLAQLRAEPQKIVRDVVIPETITVQELANRMAARGADVIKALMRMGVMATINQLVDGDTAELIVGEFGHKAKRVAESDVEIGLRGEADEAERLQPRPPVVTVMGHVDHGKTSLLDALRQTDVAAHEAGGITQHIGAYQVTVGSGAKITFIDTPGHAAFSEMRARGANVTDIVVLVVAANDGIMPQTVEAIRHAKAASVPIIVAINKIDLPDANPSRVKNELLSHELVPEEMGGDVQVVEVSAKTRQNLEGLIEAILLQAEVLDLKANPARLAEGVVIEAKLERGRGSVATVLVQRGTLKMGDIFVTGGQWGRARALVNERGEMVEQVGPSVPVEVLGLQGTPLAGDDFVVLDSEGRAREIAEFRQRRSREAQAKLIARGTLDEMFSKIAAGEARELPVVVKSDVQGSLEAIVNSLSKLSTAEVAVRVLHSAVGAINESDITLAKASEAIVIGFNVRANPQARELARRDGIDIRYYSIIYNVIDDVKSLLSGLLAPTLRERFLGYAEIREIFTISKVGKVAGCYVTEGTVKRGAKVRLLRDNVVIHEGALKTLKRFKDEVREVKAGMECGMAFENYSDIQQGDQIECFEVEHVARAL
ncbi:MAG TPA: translation initiation factor IF-2 [Alphaproteobacteria bacterium]|nr:translation initiation factor IF-2 [Alphaproteobacteria bacterium]